MEGWSEGADGGEGEVRVKMAMTSLRKMLSWISGLLDGNGPLPPFPHPPEMYSASRVPVPTWLVNGRGVEYFTLHSADSLLTPLLLAFFCLTVH